MFDKPLVKHGKYCSMNEQGVKQDVFKILRVLTSENTLSQRELSGELGFSLGKTNYLIRSLATKGFIKVIHFTTRPNKATKLSYLLTQKGLDEKLKLTYYFLKRKEQEYLELKREVMESQKSRGRSTMRSAKSEVRSQKDEDEKGFV